MNLYVPDVYDERIHRLALGIEVRDAASGQRLGRGVDVRLEQHPSPVDRWRTWPPGASFTAALPRLDRHHSGRFARCFDQDVPAAPVCRIVSDVVRGAVREVGRGRTIVPRRVRFVVPPADTPVEPWRRVFPLWCFPGASAPLTSGTTVLRGRVVRDVAGELVPVRWARVRARTALGDDIGWAHGDDRGEFVLVIGPDDDVVVPADPLPVDLTVGAQVPPPVPDPADPLRPRVDPLWDLPIEDLVAAADPDSEPTMTGRAFLPDHNVVTAPVTPTNPILLPLGTQTVHDIRIA